MNKYYNIFMTVYAITDTKKGEQGLPLLIFKLPQYKSRVAASNSVISLD